MKNKIITIELLNKLFNYLGTRPFVEVFQLIEELQKLKDVETNSTKES